MSSAGLPPARRPAAAMLELITTTGADLLRSLATPRGLALSAASLIGLFLIIAASYVRTMVLLRTLTALSSAFLLGAAVLAANPVSVLVFCILLPLNSYRLIEIVRLTRKVTEAASDGDLSGLWMKPYMKAHRHRAGTVLFRKGDPADALYLLVEGSIEFAEIGKRQPPGELFGEVAFFSQRRERTLSATCVTDCLLLSIAGPTFKQLYFENPRFAFQVSYLIAQRLGSDIQRLQRRVETLEAGAVASGEMAATGR
jgi:CRP/FNR family cyclic AMP-dependent transcriptional regulator